jgi:steroid 5-alpha reductase family enzyme
MSSGSKGLQFSFVLHAMVYAMVLVGLWRINSTTSSFDWVSIVAWGWGIGLLAHGAVWFMYGRGGQSSGRRASR